LGDIGDFGDLLTRVWGAAALGLLADAIGARRRGGIAAMKYTHHRIVLLATEHKPGSLPVPLPAHDDLGVLVRTESPVWVRFGSADMGPVDRDERSIFVTNTRWEPVPPEATHVRVRAECARTPVQIEGVTTDQPVVTPGLCFTPNEPPFLPIVPGGAGFAMNQCACFGRDHIENGLARPWTYWPITTLAPNGPGSLAECARASGPRIAVFNISGLIDFHELPDDDRDIKITSGDLYIAGETAPWPGITVCGAQWVIDVGRARNVVFSHFASFQYPYIDKNKQDSRGDCLDVYIDDDVATEDNNLLSSNMCYGHGNDEIISHWKGAAEFSYYQCVFAEALNNTDNLEQAEHGFGPYVSCDKIPNSRGDFQRCIFMHAKARGPSSAVPLFSIINCVNFNHWQRCLELSSLEGRPTKTNVEGCLYMDGPDGAGDAIFVQDAGGALMSSASEYYLAENRALGDYDDSTQASLLSDNDPPGSLVTARITDAHPPGAVVTKIGDQREDFVRLVARHAGPFPAQRSPILQRLMGYIDARLTGVGDQGGAIDYPEDVGGMPALEENLIDHTQGDDPIPGVINGYERQLVGDAACEIQPSGYTATEEWLDRLRARRMPADAVRVEP
jgi:hypothetical protein